MRLAGGKCSVLYETTCPGTVNTLAKYVSSQGELDSLCWNINFLLTPDLVSYTFGSCEPLCRWFQNVIVHETLAASCSCDLECGPQGPFTASPLEGQLGGAVTLGYNALSLLVNVVIAVPTDLKPASASIKTLQSIIGERATLNSSLVQVSVGSIEEAAVCGYMRVQGHPDPSYDGLWNLGNSWNNQPHYTKKDVSGNTIHLYYYHGWGGRH